MFGAALKSDIAQPSGIPKSAMHHRFSIFGLQARRFGLTAEGRGYTSIQRPPSAAERAAA